MSAADHEHLLEWNDRLQEWVDGDLDPAGAAAFERHFADCPACQAQTERLRNLDRTLRALAPGIALDAAFDARLLAQIELIDESKRVQARRRMEQELQQNLEALSRRWRRALAFVIPGVIAAVAIAFALNAWLGQSDFIGTLIPASAGELGRDAPDLIRLCLTALSGAGLGLGLTRWLTSAVE